MEKYEWWATVGLRDNVDYEKAVEEFKNKQLATAKYTSGKDIIANLFDTDSKTIKESSKLAKLNAATTDPSLVPPNTPTPTDNPTNPYN